MGGDERREGRREEKRR
jgi:hypothetical protein